MKPHTRSHAVRARQWRDRRVQPETRSCQRQGLPAAGGRMPCCRKHPSQATDHRTRITPHPSLAAHYAARRHPACPECFCEGNRVKPACRRQGSLSVFLEPLPRPFSIADSAVIFTRPAGSTRTLRMVLINVTAIRNARDSQKTNYDNQFQPTFFSLF
jgi:hypothetical protein